MLDSLIAQAAVFPWLLAQEGGGSPWGMLPAFAIIGLLFYLMLIRPQRREQQQRQSMVEALKKNDRVVTIGGMYGIVTNVRKELDQVYLNVDEKNGTVVRVTMGSIARVLGDEPAEKSENPK
jgi:preprotein translocase subunit YajC